MESVLVTGVTLLNKLLLAPVNEFEKQKNLISHPADFQWARVRDGSWLRENSGFLCAQNALKFLLALTKNLFAPQASKQEESTRTHPTPRHINLRAVSPRKVGLTHLQSSEIFPTSLLNANPFYQPEYTQTAVVLD